MTSYLLANGCSWTDPNLTPPCKHWPEFLGQFMNLDVVNIGFSGSSNRSIVARTFDYLVSHDNLPEYCVIQLSEWDRFNIINMDYSTQYKNTLGVMALKQKALRIGSCSQSDQELINNVDDNPEKEKTISLINVVTLQQNDNPINPRDFISGTLREIYTLYVYCLAHNIKLFVFQGLPACTLNDVYNMFERYGVPERLTFELEDIYRVCDPTHLKNEFEQSPYSKKLAEAEDYTHLTLRGWPFLEDSITTEIGREVTEAMNIEGTYSRDAWEEKMHIVPKKDSHPSEWVNKRIAEKIYESICG